MKTKNENIVTIKRSDGKKYSVRRDRHRYFFPNEWTKFINSITDEKHKLMFLVLLHTGARIMEALHLKLKNFDFERGSVTFEVVKQRKAKKKSYALGKSRSFFVSKKCLSSVKSYIKKNKIDANDYIFLENNKLHPHYESLVNSEKKRYYGVKLVSYSKILKRKLKSVGVTDYQSFSLHNIRKTYGNWMRIYDIRLEELCYRMGHDMETFLAHYGSAMIFTGKERMDIMKIMGEVR